MRYLTVLLLLTIARANRLASQDPAGKPPTRNWSLVYASGSMATLKGGGTSLMGAPTPTSMSFRLRVGRSRWWIGLDRDYWSATANAAGIDSLRARSGIAGLNTESGAKFFAGGVAASVRYDAWRHGPLVAYGLGSIGAVGSGGFFYPICHVETYPKCERDYLHVDTPGLKPATAVGGGLLVHVLTARGWWQAFPSRLLAEARLSSLRTRDGRLTSMPLLIGFSW